jgi:replicative DNA helicase
MPTFDYTVELERSLLKIVSSSVIMARRYIHRVNPSFFTTAERKFVFEVLEEALRTTGQLATRKVFEYEVGKRVEDTDQQYFIGEWNLVEAVDTQDPPEVLIKKLNEANIGRDILKTGAEVDTLLENGNIEEALSRLKQGAMAINAQGGERSLVELTDFSTRDQTILDKKTNPAKYRGLSTGFDYFDKITGGLYGGELTLVAGLTGLGKSTFVRQLEMNVVIMNPGKNVLHIANEEYQEQVEHKFDANFTEIPYLDFKRGDISPEDLERWREYMRNWNHGRIFLKEVPAFTEVTLAEQAYRECESKGIEIHLIIIDHLPHVKPIQKTWGENDELKKAAGDCKELARWLHIPVVVPTQAATVVEKKQERGKRGGKLDVYGSKAQVHVSNTFILITDKGKDETQVDLEDWERDVFWLVDVKKNRDGPAFWLRAKHRVQIGRIEEVAGQGGKGSPADDAKAEDLMQKDEGVADDAQAAAVRASLAEADGDNVKETELPPPEAPPATPVEHKRAVETVLSRVRKMRQEKKANSAATPSV